MDPLFLAIGGLFGSGIFLVVVVFLISKLIQKKKEHNLEEWAKKQGLNYRKKVGFSYGMAGDIKDLIWGEYNGNKIFAFKCIGISEEFVGSVSSGKRGKVGYVFFNNKLYLDYGVEYGLNAKTIDAITKGEVAEIDPGESRYLSRIGNGSLKELVLSIMSGIYLEKGELLDYDVCQKIIKSLAGFNVSKQNTFKKIFNFIFKNKYLGKLNSEEAQNYLINLNFGIDPKLVTEVAKMHQKIVGY